MKSRKEGILQVTDYLAPYEGNFICSIKNLEEHLNSEGYNMFYLFPKEAKNLNWIKQMRKENKKIFYLDKYVAKNIKTIKNIIKENNIKIVHSHFCLPLTQLAVKLSCITSLNVYLVQHYHNHFKLPNKLLKKYVFKFIFEGDLNIGCSESVENSIIYNSKKVFSVPNAIYFPRLDKYEKIDKSKFGIRDDDIVILMFGFDYLRKGVDIAIKAIEALSKKYNIILAISVSVGKEKIEKQIESDFGHIPNWIKLLPPRNDISSYYHMSNIFLSAAREEGFCYALVEAAYCKLSCISSNISGPPLDIPNLTIFENEDYKDLLNKIENIVNTNTIETKKKLDETSKYVLEKYNIDKWSKEIINIYQLTRGDFNSERFNKKLFNNNI